MLAEVSNLFGHLVKAYALFEHYIIYVHNGILWNIYNPIWSKHGTPPKRVLI
jgi:hypothetical protein